MSTCLARLTSAERGGRRAALLVTGCLVLASLPCPVRADEPAPPDPFKFRVPAPSPTPGLFVKAASEPEAVPVDPPDFTSPPLRKLPAALLESFAGLIDSDNLVPAVIGASAAAASLAADGSTRDYFQKRRRAQELGTVGDRLGNGFVLAGVTGALVAASYSGENQKFRAMSFSLAQGFIMTEALVHSVKAVTDRYRPDGRGENSFPSGHTSSMFTYATVISHYYGARAAIPAYSVASLVGLSRIEKNRHHLSDVVAGAALGYLIGRTVVQVTDRRAASTHMTVQPVVSPEVTALSVRWTW